MGKIMKKLTILAILVAGIAQAQNFKITNNDLVWSKVYQGSPEGILKNRAILDLEVGEGYYTGRIERISNKGDAFRIKRMLFPIYGSRSRITSANVLVEIKADRYRVTVSNIWILVPGLNLTGNALYEFAWSEKRNRWTKHWSKKVRTRAIPTSPEDVFDYMITQTLENGITQDDF